MNCLYLHIPFCRKKCDYCSFNSEGGLDSLHPRYRQALIKEILSSQKSEKLLESLFIGGGTPTLLNASDLGALIEACADKYGFAEDAEISIEANPESVDHHLLEILREAGFNRLSIGIQSFNDDELKRLGRLHDSAMSEEAVTAARQAGFDNLSIDLMYGLPGQSVKSWQETMRSALELDPTHLSAYQLTIEEGTQFYKLEADGSLYLPPDEAVLEMDGITQELCTRAGLQHYEISNYARPGYQCRHNLNYWHNNDYLACGAGSVSYVQGLRERRIGDPLSYCEAVEQGRDLIVEEETLSAIDSFKETVVMGLRLIEGISGERLRKRYGMSLEDVYGETLGQLAERGLLEYDGSRLALSETGRRFANQVMAELV